MTKVAFFSDLHGHPFQPYATILSNGMNSRLYDAVFCLAQIRHYCIVNNIKTVLFGGDLFHVRRTINVSAFNAVYEELSEFRHYGINVFLIHGNHDQANKDGDVHSLKALKDISRVISDPGWVRVAEGVNVLCVPYLEDVEALREIVKFPEMCKADHKLFLGHFGIQGAQVGADFVYAGPHDPKVEDLCCETFDRVYLGHYHIHQQVADNGYYIGATLAHNWGDKNQTRGFLVYDTEARDHEFIELKSPKFVELDHSAEAYAGGDDFVRIVDTYDKWDKQRVANAKAEWGCRSLETIKPKQLVIPQQRIDVSSNSGFSEIVDKYVKSQTLDGDLDDNYLKALGSEILDEVGHT